MSRNSREQVTAAGAASTYGRSTLLDDLPEGDGGHWLTISDQEGIAEIDDEIDQQIDQGDQERDPQDRWKIQTDGA